MRNALVIGASGGIGSAVGSALSSRGVKVTALSRSSEGLEITDSASVDRIIGTQNGPFELIFVATGILAPVGGRPEKSLDKIDAATMGEVLSVNTIGPALILRHVPNLLPRKRRSVVAILSARVGSISDNRLGGWYAYRASKAAVNQLVRTAAIEIRRKHKESVVVALHPGTVETEFTSEFSGYHKVSPRIAADNLLHVIDGLTPSDTGGFFDWAGKEVPW